VTVESVWLTQLIVVGVVRLKNVFLLVNLLVWVPVRSLRVALVPLIRIVDNVLKVLIASGALVNPVVEVLMRSVLLVLDIISLPLVLVKYIEHVLLVEKQMIVIGAKIHKLAILQ